MSDSFIKQFEAAWQPLDPQVVGLLTKIYTAREGQPPLYELAPPVARRNAAGLSFLFGAGAPALPHIEERTIQGASGPIRVRLYDPGVAAPAPTVVFFHGGGWVLFDIDLYDGVARQLAKRSGMRVLSVEYALAPEHPFPVPLNDCMAAVRWAISEGKSLGIDPKRIALAGDSAGANLALAAALALRDAGASPVRGAALIYGSYSPATDTPSYRAYGGGEYFMGVLNMVWFWKNYLPGDAARRDPLAAPLLANLKGLPPLYVAASEFDVLRNDSEQLVEKLKSAGVDVEFRLWKGMIHACMNFMGWIDAMGPEIDRVGAFLRRVTQAGR